MGGGIYADSAYAIPSRRPVSYLGDLKHESRNSLHICTSTSHETAYKYKHESSNSLQIQARVIKQPTNTSHQIAYKYKHESSNSLQIQVKSVTSYAQITEEDWRRMKLNEAERHNTQPSQGCKRVRLSHL